ncbi:MAG: triose-phosphate isomerase [Thermoplasmata archaeon]|nr:triose-phosphate isomerase [Thermoplasmata archaeon]
MGTSTRSVLGHGGRRRRSPISARALGSPLLLLNLKSYPEALGPGAERIGRSLALLGRRAHVAVALAPATCDLGWLAHELTIPVLSQHVDPLDAGARTGYLVPAAVAACGAKGSLLNHSEHPMAPREVADGVRRLNALGLSAIVCARDVRTAARLARTKPPYLAVEPPELIGGEVSVSTARPEVVSGAVRAVRKVSPRTRVLCGAGVHGAEDVRKALELGSSGVLVASAVARSPRPAAAIRDLLDGFGPP